MRASKTQLPYDDHERALKFLYTLDQKVLAVKVSTIIESANYDTLTVDELFSKLKSTEIDYQTQAKIKNPSASTIALVSGNGSSSLANLLQLSFALSSLVSISEEQLEVLGDDELALIISRFSRFQNNRLNRRHGGGPKEGCYGYGDPNHFVAHCPKKNKNFSSKHDFDKRKDKREYTSSKHKSKGDFDKEALKKKYLKKAKAQERAFHASLSDLDNNTDDHHPSSSLSNNESERKCEDKLIGLCFVVGSTPGAFYTMADDAKVKANKDVAPIDDDSTGVTSSIVDLAAELESMNATLLSQDRLLKCAAHERKKFMDKLEIALKELEEAKKFAVAVSDDVECDECAIHMTNITELQSNYAILLEENDELKSRSSLLGACKSC
jgi:hypothetical protein